jgi:uncharacterized protein YdhG (YjbR/CyaY superfamily)
MQNPAATVAEYLQSLPPDRRESINAVRKVILANMDPLLEEGMTYGMIGYYVPHRHYPAGYHCDPKMPLPYAGLASQKNHMSLYTMSVYGHMPTLEWFQKAWAKSGKKLDMGKSCIRFKKLEDLPLDVIGELVRKVPVAKYIGYYEDTIKGMVSRKPADKAKAASKKKPAPGKPAAKKGKAK